MQNPTKRNELKELAQQIAKEPENIDELYAAIQNNRLIQQMRLHRGESVSR